MAQAAGVEHIRALLRAAGRAETVRELPDSTRTAARFLAAQKRLRECERERDLLRAQHAALLAVDANLLASGRLPAAAGLERRTTE